MKADEPTGNVLVRLVRAWNSFWFEPGDPTTLGLIRLCAGVLVLYTHYAYSYDLHEFFGRDAWYSQASVNRDRKETPHFAPPTGWEQPVGGAALPKAAEAPPRELAQLVPDPVDRAQIVKYIRQFPQEEPERSRLIRLLKSPQLPENADWGKLTPPEAIRPIHGALGEFIETLPSDPAERNRILDYIGEWGIDPRHVETGSAHWSVWYHLSDPTWMVVVHGLILLVMLMFTVGFCTRVTSVLTWLAALSYINRSPNTFYGADAMMMVTLMYLMIGPSGAALSVDRWLARRRGQEQGPPAPSVSANFAIRLFQIQFCIIYFAAGSSKLLGGRWWNGQALYYTLANYEFSPIRHEYFQEMLAWLCQTRWLWEIVISAGSWFTIALELTLPLLVWNRRLRLPLVFCSLLLHTFIALFMGLAVFSMMMGTMVLSFVPGTTMARWLEIGRGRLERFWSPAPDRAEPRPEVKETSEPAPKKAERKARHGSRR